MVHAANKRKVRVAAVLRGDEHAISLRSSHIDHICIGRLGVNTVHFDHLHGVVLEPDVVSGKCADVDHAELVCLSRLDFNGEILRLIDES